MNKDKWIILEGTVRKKEAITGLDKDIVVRVICKEQYAVCWFSDSKLTKRLTTKEKADGKDVTYNDTLKVMIERFEGKTAKEVATIIGKEMKAAGGELQIK